MNPISNAKIEATSHMVASIHILNFTTLDDFMKALPADMSEKVRHSMFVTLLENLAFAASAELITFEDGKMVLTKKAKQMYDETHKVNLTKQV